MGYRRHHAMIITSHAEKEIKQARHVASIFFDDLVSNIIQSPVNSYYSFFIAPDGSKEWWPDSDKHDGLRSQYKKWLRDNKYDNYYSWAEVQFGDEEGIDALIDKG